MTTAFDVAVVGGGLSGMAAARDLMRSGLSNFVVLEARDRVGGRTVTQYADGIPVDGGGTWVNPNQTAVIDLLHELGIERFPQYTEGDAFAVIAGNATRPSPPLPIPPSPGPWTKWRSRCRSRRHGRRAMPRSGTR